MRADEDGIGRLQSIPASGEENAGPGRPLRFVQPSNPPNEGAEQATLDELRLAVLQHDNLVFLGDHRLRSVDAAVIEFAKTVVAGDLSILCGTTKDDVNIGFGRLERHREARRASELR